MPKGVVFANESIEQFLIDQGIVINDQTTEEGSPCAKIRLSESVTIFVQVTQRGLNRCLEIDLAEESVITPEDEDRFAGLKKKYLGR